MHGTSVFAEACAKAVPSLVEMITANVMITARSGENIIPTENAISAVTKILKFNSSALNNVDDLIGLWMSWLPVGEDQDEVSHVYGYLCDLIQENHPAVVRPNRANLPRVLAIIAEARSKEVLEPDSDFYSRILSTVVDCLRPDEKGATDDAHYAPILEAQFFAE